jgi:hypothetical protein
MCGPLSINISLLTERKLVAPNGETQHTFFTRSPEELFTLQKLFRVSQFFPVGFSNRGILQIHRLQF